MIGFDKAAAFEPGQLQQGTIASSPYLAPEIISGFQYDERCDIWSVGVVLYVMITGTTPFLGQTVEEIKASIRMGKPDYS